MPAEEKEPEAVTNFREYLRIKTVPPNPDYAGAAEWLVKYSKSAGISSQVIEVEKGYPIIVMTVPGMDPSLKSLLLYSHTDVVPVFPDKWTHDPFAAEKDDQGNIYARGAQDMKCVGIQYVEALKLIMGEGQNLKRTIHVVWSPDEEIGGLNGMGKWISHESFRSLNVGFALDEGLASENDEYKLFYAERWNAPVQFTCSGRPGHGSKFINDSAAEKMRSVINSMLDLRNQQEAKLKADPSLTLGDMITTNLTQIQGGVQLNVVPAELTVGFDCRVPPKISEENGALTDVSNNSESYPPWKAIMDTFKSMKLGYSAEVFTGATDSRYLRKEGINSYGFSPMRNTPVLLHDNDEFLNESTFLEGIQIYRQLIPALADCDFEKETRYY